MNTTFENQSKESLSDGEGALLEDSELVNEDLLTLKVHPLDKIPEMSDQ